MNFFKIISVLSIEYMVKFVDYFNEMLDVRFLMKLDYKLLSPYFSLLS